MGNSSPDGLEVWRKAVALSNEVGRLARKLPQYELFELASQLRRAADSISSNIAEGKGRSSIKDYINFLHNAKGSNFEVQTQLRLCVGHGYLHEAEIRKAMNPSVSVYILLSKLIASLEKKDEEARQGKKNAKRNVKMKPGR